MRRIVALQRAYELMRSVESPDWDAGPVIAALRHALQLAVEECDAGGVAA